MRRSRIYDTDAIILRRIDFGEADRMLTLIAPHLGKLRVLAKGARKMTSRKSGHVELFARVRLQLAKGRNFDIVTQAEIIEPHRALREDVARASVAHYMCELAEQFAQEGSDESPLYDLLGAALLWLCGDSDALLVARAFEMRLLTLAGFRPQLFRCVKTNDPIDLNLAAPGQTWAFSPAEGGVLSGAAASFARDDVQINATVLLTMRALQTQPFDALAHLKVTEYLHGQLERALRHYLNYIVERAPQARRFMREVFDPAHGA